MNIDLAALPDDVETLQRLVRSLAAERTSLSEAQAEIERLQLIIKKLQRSQFGRRAERLDDDQLQLGFEDLDADLARVEATLPSTQPRARPPKSRDDRPSLPAHLPREDMRLDVEHQACPCCGGALHLIGETRQRDARPRAGAAAGHPHPPAALWLPGLRDHPSGPGPGAADRQGPGHPRPAGPCAGLQILRSPSALPAEPDLRPAGRRARPLDAGELGRRRLLVAGAAAGTASPSTSSPRKSCSPTTRRSRCSIPAAAAPRPAGCGSMPAMTGPGTDPIRRPRSISTAPIARPSVLPLIWPSFNGIVQVDGYAGFERLTDGGDIQLAACWAHARRKFYEVHQATGSPIAAEALRRIAELYAIEAAIRGQTADARARACATPSRCRWSRR